MRRRDLDRGEPVTYPPGYFTEPVRAWKQMQFVSALQADVSERMAQLARAERSRQRATGSGWGGGTIDLAGTPDFAPRVQT